MKSMILVGVATLISGCSLVTQPPSEAKARRLEEGRPGAEKAAQVQAATRKLEDRGLTSQEARSLAEAQVRAGQR